MLKIRYTSIKPISQITSLIKIMEINNQKTQNLLIKPKNAEKSKNIIMTYIFAINIFYLRLLFDS